MYVDYEKHVFIIEEGQLVENNKTKVIYLDGAMGTMLQASGLQPGEIPEVYGYQHPEIIEQIHAAYAEAGSDIVYTNTFGANAKKLATSGYSVEDIITAAIQQAKRSVDSHVNVALDIGPIGEMLEPNGYLSFEAAYDIFKEMVLVGEQAGADLVVFETMSDLMEVKAAVLAAKENTRLPIFVTMSFEADHRTFTGCNAASFALLCERLGVSAIGINCSLGPTEILPIAKELAQYTSLPLIIKANAGLPDPITNTYDIDADDFAQLMKSYCALPIRYIGGCCGTTPDFIRAMKNQITETVKEGPAIRTPFACTPTRCVNLDGVRVIGERINPTGNKRMKEALLQQNMDAILSIAMEQIEAGADLLDVNVGLPGIDEKTMMVNVIKELQTVVDVPLQIDSTDVTVIEAALRVYNGIANVNSVNGEQESMNKILPIIQKYGANIVGLTLDEKGIPESGEARYQIGKRIVDEAATYGITSNRVFLDCLTLTVSAQQTGAQETLNALNLIRDHLGVKTVLGVSNISFGLPRRLLLNQSFLTLALHAGLTMPIINPNQGVMMEAVRSYRVLNVEDVDAMDYIHHYSNVVASTPINKETTQLNIQEAIAKGLKEETRSLTKELLKRKQPLEIVNHELIPALDLVGDRYEKKEIYLPQLINAATASQFAFEELKAYMRTHDSESIAKGKILLATVRGDVHDIGKNIVKVVLENYGYQIFDLGKDVPVQAVVDTAIRENIPLIGLSALMTTTLVSMEETVIALRASGHSCKIMVGGAVVSPEYAKKIGADYYAKDAKESADIAKEVFG